MEFALINAGVVVNVIIADAAFIAAHSAELAEQCVELTAAKNVTGQRPGPDWSYNAGTGKFARPAK
jgi:hypothetical protein